MAAIALTHGHNDHINAAVALAEAVDAPVWLHPDDRMLWDVVHPDRAPDRDLADGDGAGRGRRASWPCCTRPATPPAAAASTWRAGGGADGAGLLFCGDTLFCGGPGATGRSHSDFPTIIRSIRERLLQLPPETVVHTGHGESTTIGAEAPHLEDWIARGH